MKTDDTIKKEQMIFSMIVKTLRLENNNQFVNIIKKSEMHIECYSYDNWDGGTYYENLVFYFGLIDYNNIPDKDNVRNTIKRIFDSFYSDESHIVTDIVFKVKMEQFVDWEAIYPITQKDLLFKLNTEKMYLIKSATGTSIETIESEFKTNNLELRKLFSQLGIDYFHNITSLWDWYRLYSQLRLDTYESRRKYVNNLFNQYRILYLILITMLILKMKSK